MTDAPAAGSIRVVVRDIPAELVLRTQDHLDELVRELQIVSIGAESGAATAVPKSIATLLASLVERYAELRALNRAIAVGAVDRGDGTVTLEMDLPPSAAEDIRRILDLIDEADRVCQEGDLLTLASPADVREFRRRAGEEILRQLEG